MSISDQGAIFFNVICNLGASSIKVGNTFLLFLLFDLSGVAQTVDRLSGPVVNIRFAQHRENRGNGPAPSPL